MSLRRLAPPAFLLLQLAGLPAAEAAPGERDRVTCVLHGSRAAYGKRQGGSGWGYGAGGSVSYYDKQHLRYWVGADHDRVPRSSSYTWSITSYAAGLELGPRRVRRAEPYSRLGLGFHAVDARYWDFYGPTGQIVSAAYRKNYAGVHLEAGVHARPSPGTLFELGLSVDPMFAGAQSDAPALDSATLLRLHAGLGYSFR